MTNIGAYFISAAGVVAFGILIVLLIHEVADRVIDRINDREEKR